jgi:hypothetical protein
MPKYSKLAGTLPRPGTGGRSLMDHSPRRMLFQPHGWFGRSATLAAALDGSDDMPLALVGLDYLSDDRDADE